MIFLNETSIVNRKLTLLSPPFALLQAKIKTENLEAYGQPRHTIKVSDNVNAMARRLAYVSSTSVYANIRLPELVLQCIVNKCLLFGICL